MTNRIEHVVVLMLENRSFDHMLGFVDHPSADFGQLTVGAYTNPTDPTRPKAAMVPVNDSARLVFELDPPHSYKSVIEQLGPRLRGPARMNGFVAAYARKAAGKEERAIIHWWRFEGLAVVVGAALAGGAYRLTRWWIGAVVGVIVVGGGSVGLWLWKRSWDKPPVVPGVGPQAMACMAPAKVPVLATLARSFAVCTRWFASVPGETWPNRNFLHSGTSDGAVDIEIGFYDSPTVFDRLEDAGASWRVYHQGRAHLWAFPALWDGERIANWHGLDEIVGHIASGDLATYSFVEPDHAGSDSNSQHPGNNAEAAAPGESDFERGERLVARVYEALRARPDVFAKTLLLVTHDEHGGLFDHVPPPTRVPAPSPSKRYRVSLTRRIVSWFVERRHSRFNFRVLGLRVPALVISPWVEAGTVDQTVYDHTSVIATVRKLFAPATDPLTKRDAWAATFDHLVARRAEPRPVTDLPDLSAAAAEPRPTATFEPPPTAAAAVPADELTQQLAVLADQVSAELPRRHTDVAPASAGEGTTTRFRGAAQARRSRRPTP